MGQVKQCLQEVIHVLHLCDVLHCLRGHNMKEFQPTSWVLCNKFPSLVSNLLFAFSCRLAQHHVKGRDI